MYAMVRSYAGGAELADVLVENEAEIRGLFNDIAGFSAYYMVRTEDGGAVSVSVFADRDGAEESNRVAAAWVGENVPDLELDAPQVSGGEVAVSF